VRNADETCLLSIHTISDAYRHPISCDILTRVGSSRWDDGTGSEVPEV